MDPGVSPGTRPAAAPFDSSPGESTVDGDLLVRRQRAWRRSIPGLVRSTILVVGVVVAVVLAVPRPSSTPHHFVDVVVATRDAATTLGFAPAVPLVPQDWVATSAGVRNSSDGVSTWHIGYLTADGHYASIEQAATVTSRWEEILDSGGTPRDPQTIDGTLWEQRYKDVRDVYALIHRGKDRTTMVTSKGGGLAGAVVLARSIPVTFR